MMFLDRPSTIYCLNSINHLRVAYLIHYRENDGGVCGVKVEATAVTLCHGKLNCWPINSVYRFYIRTVILRCLQGRLIRNT